MRMKDGTLFADDGKVLTNGTDYGTTISLGNGVSDKDYREITMEEYNNILKEHENALVIDDAEVM